MATLHTTEVWMVFVDDWKYKIHRGNIIAYCDRILLKMKVSFSSCFKVICKTKCEQRSYFNEMSAVAEWFCSELEGCVFKFHFRGDAAPLGPCLSSQVDVKYPSVQWRGGWVLLMSPGDICPSDHLMFVVWGQIGPLVRVFCWPGSTTVHPDAMKDPIENDLAFEYPISEE